jgi:hypothetical protein
MTPRVLRDPVPRTVALLIATALLPIVAVASLSHLCDASFGATPSLSASNHVLFGLWQLFGFGFVGTAVATLGLFHALRHLSLAKASCAAALLCVPSLFFGLCQLWAAAMFVGWA